VALLKHKAEDLPAFRERNNAAQKRNISIKPVKEESKGWGLSACL
jgi:hypothetical protein